MIAEHLTQNLNIQSTKCSCTGTTGMVLSLAAAPIRNARAMSKAITRAFYANWGLGAAASIGDARAATSEAVAGAFNAGF
jgi:hypothetical protein